MLLTRMSIKSRLLILCLLPTIVIILLSANLVNQIQGRLHSYKLISDKNSSINLLMEFSHHSYSALSKRLNSQSGQTSIALASSTLKLLSEDERLKHGEGLHKYQQDMAASYIQELIQLFPELSLASPHLKKPLNSVGSFTPCFMICMRVYCH